MQKAKTKVIPHRGGKRPKALTSSSEEVNANEVIDTLLRLFKDLGIDVTHPISTTDELRKPISTAHTLYPFASAIGEMLTHWHQDPEYLDEKGNPARIKYRGKRPSFRSLAQLMVPTIDVTFLLSELERLGAVSIDDSKLISVHMRSFPVYEDKRLAVQHTLTILDGFMKTLRHNLESSPSNSDQLFHRIAWNNNFDSREIQALKVRVKKQGQNFLESMDDWLTRKSLSKARKPNNRLKRAKVSIGVYLSVDSKPHNRRRGL
jgi:hypothetical protein